MNEAIIKRYFCILLALAAMLAVQNVNAIVDKILGNKWYSKPASRKEAGKCKRDKQIARDIVIP